MYDAIPFLRRQPVIIVLGMLGWLLGVWQLGTAAMEQKDSPSLLLLALSGIGPAMALVRLFWILVTTKRWQRDNRDPVIWGMVVITYGSACALAARLSLTPTQGFFLVFLMVNMAPLMNRFAAPLAIGVIVITSLAVTVLQQALPPIPFAIYLLLAQSALWYMASSNIDEWQAHQETATAHAQLHATQQLLTEAVARNERTRIARDLHDQMGHHLVALTMQLQVLEKKLPDAALPELGQARDLARDLFEDVRATLLQLRQDQSDFGELLERMLANIPYLKYDVEIDSELLMLDAQLASCLLRVVQEAITNALKHSDASRMRVILRRDDHGGIRMEVQDNGRMVRLAEFGSGLGLGGLEERVAELGGHLQAGPTGEGFRLVAEFPEECLT
ncbi:MAG: sensor histidine kinase [Fluviicoccus sp.]|uniref:sensor histidine kinase n=1 Tax=Fluviicoccus sp. TaxID=2003552 RepID=UPI0027158938|nr:sensor histidine kinase [Fluviicoccus sp.]MDO8329531.1 sensor histidine kinase [Fluviicoccus sp.]